MHVKCYSPPLRLHGERLPLRQLSMVNDNFSQWRRNEARMRKAPINEFAGCNEHEIVPERQPVLLLHAPVSAH
ncbi:hypothetical protein KIN20_019670 [Parelaphostrongylus tenuis]|uniref:Uncharacterized protein n=1 Tax=Parelaphostrongylus tenuis TaxID=148309 RepID=A0AAD5N8Z5_PARTN|nr:hypothetical protein KIN20_019670 [Parelaphostrongylus tenuis]